MAEPIFLKNLKGADLEPAKKSGKDGNGKLEKTKNLDEISLFYNKKIEGAARRDATYVARSPQLQTGIPRRVVKKMAQLNVETDTASLIRLEAENKGFKLSAEDVKYWTGKTDKIAKVYNVPAELLVSIISTETGFKKNVNSSNGAGPMQITTISVQDFFPDAKGNWNNIYKKMNEKLLNDILYKKDKNGNFIKDAKGNNVLKYKTPEELRKACTQDDELGMKVGLLTFEMKYVKAVATKQYGKATYANVPKAIAGLKDGSIKLNEKQNKAAVTLALKNYNSVFKSYAPAVVDSLSTMGMEFANLYFIPRHKA